MKNYHVYILKCNDNSYYTGVTNDMDRRLWEHENGENVGCYTFFRRPLELVFCELFFNVRHAIEFEKQIKGWSRQKKEALIARNWDVLKELSICKNGTNSSNYKK